MTKPPAEPWNDRGPGKSPDCTNNDCIGGWDWDIAESFPEPCPNCWIAEDPKEGINFLARIRNLFGRS
ncbi:hypothetical protein [Arthrobacter alpinus]|uniref:hypothetical protein n=1 Tax=Arthrobacter alpinus TaxID=656366 RepID=UPI000A7D8A44|nr:hypothetical protein [Arthrobacter alpinus]